MNKEVDNLLIYKQYIELIYYTEMITEKYPKIEKQAIVPEIKTSTYEGMKLIILAFKVYGKDEKMAHLNQLDVHLKFLKVLIRVSHKRKYISSKNYTSWVKKITNIGNLLGGWIKACQKR